MSARMVSRVSRELSPSPGAFSACHFPCWLRPIGLAFAPLMSPMGEEIWRESIPISRKNSSCEDRSSRVIFLMAAPGKQLHHAIQNFIGHDLFGHWWNLFGPAGCINYGRVIYIAAKGRVRTTYGVNNDQVQI